MYSPTKKLSIFDFVYKLKVLTDRISKIEKGSEQAKNHRIIRKFW